MPKSVIFGVQHSPETKGNELAKFYPAGGKITSIKKSLSALNNLKSTQKKRNRFLRSNRSKEDYFPDNLNFD